jgi:tetratricopeptide (TPR) repeat protein
VQGRLLVWKVSSRMVADQPLTGVGYDRFGAEFGNYQAEYFAKENAAQWEKQVAGYEQYAFNEYLQIASETGLVGLLLFLGITGTLLIPFFKKIKHGKKDANAVTIPAAASGLLGILIFALFSYPFSIMPLLMVGVFVGAVLAGFSKHITTLAFRRWTCIMFLAFFGTGIYNLAPYAQKQYKAYKQWRQAYTHYRFGNYKATIDGYSKAYPELKCNGRFLTNYGKALSMGERWEKGLQVLDRTKHYHSGPIIYTAQGNCYKALKNYEKAEEAYQHAWQIIPSRFYPLYLLAKLHDESNRPEKAIQTARQVLNKEVKIPSTAVNQIRQEMKEIIEKHTK